MPFPHPFFPLLQAANKAHEEAEKEKVQALESENKEDEMEDYPAPMSIGPPSVSHLLSARLNPSAMNPSPRHSESKD